jgi:hypothetical protein
VTTPRDPRSGRGPGSTPGTPAPGPRAPSLTPQRTPIVQGQRLPTPAPLARPTSQTPRPLPQQQQQQHQQQQQQRRPLPQPQHAPEPDPIPLDLDALDELDALDTPTLGGGPGEVLDADALMELDPEALFAEALADADTGRESAADAGSYGEPIALDESALGEVIIEENIPVDDTPLVEGFENTRLDDEFDRRSKKKPGEASSRRAPRADFEYASCPACNSPQPQPAPPFCEQCGTRMRKPQKKTETVAGPNLDGAAKRCGECGFFRNRPDATNCTNCGSRLATED